MTQIDHSVRVDKNAVELGELNFVLAISIHDGVGVSWCTH